MLQVWRDGTQVQRISVMEEGKRGEEESRGKGGTCGFATKGAVREEVSMSYKGKSAGRKEEAEESRGRREDGTCGQATKRAARVEEKLSKRAKKESRRALWKRHPRKGAIIRTRVVYGGSSSSVPNL